MSGHQIEDDVLGVRVHELVRVGRVMGIVKRRVGRAGRALGAARARHRLELGVGDGERRRRALGVALLLLHLAQVGGERLWFPWRRRRRARRRPLIQSAQSLWLASVHIYK